MKELSIEEKAKAYDEAYKRVAVRFGSNVANEIFHELTESEDERIRKEIIYHIQHCDDTIDEVAEKRMIAWLEKQGEHANFRNKIQIGDKVTRNEDGVLVNLSQLKRIAKSAENKGKHNMGISEATKQELEDNLHKALEKETPESCNEFLKKQGEQKAKYHDVCDKCARQPTCQSDCFLQQGKQMPAENKGMNLVEEEMTPFQKKVFCIIDTTIEEEQGLKQVCDELLRLAHDEIMQTPAEWSEEDKKILDDIIDSGKHACFLTVKQTEWLETLKDRVQPKQEWSEEDNYVIERLFCILDNEQDNYPQLSCDFQEIQEIKEWLEFIKDRVQSQNTWKPSDEQMAALNYVVNLMASSERPTENDLYYNILKSLRQQLMKLKDEK